MFIDIHAHAWRYALPFNADCEVNLGTPPTPEQIIGRYDEVGIDRGVLLPMVNPEIYLTQSNEDILDFFKAYPERFIPFCNIDPRTMKNTSDAPLGDWLRYYRDQGCKGIGEVMPFLPFRHPQVQNLFRHVEDVGFPLIFDLAGDVYGLYDDVGLPQLEYSLQKFPKLKFFGHGQAFWSEIGQLETVFDRTGYPSYPIKEEGVVPKLLRKYEHLYGDLSAGSGFNALNRDRKYAIKFIHEFQDKLLFGTDIYTSEMPTPMVEFLNELKKCGDISEQVFNKVARENAIRILNL